jgi:transcriptional regulator with XRE-family HTH domain
MFNYTYEQFGELILKIRKSRKMSLTELSNISSVSKSTLSSLENGKQNITLETFFLITNALNIQPYELNKLFKYDSNIFSLTTRIMGYFIDEDNLIDNLEKILNQLDDFQHYKKSIQQKMLAKIVHYKIDSILDYKLNMLEFLVKQTH